MMEQIRIIFGSIPSYLYPHLITALLIGVAVGLILGLTFVYSILFMPMQRRLKREVVNIQMDNEKLKKDFSHYKRRARRKLKYYRDLELRSIRPDIYGDVEEMLPDTDDVDAALERSEKAVESLPPAKEKKKSSKNRKRYARAARDEPLDDVSSSEHEEEQTRQTVHEVDINETGAVESLRDPDGIGGLESHAPPVAILDDITELAMQVDVEKKSKPSRKSKGKNSFIDNIRSKQESLAKQFTETNDFDSTGMTQTIETPLQEDDIDNWQDFENEFGKELSDTSNALDIHNDLDTEDRGDELAKLRIDDTDLVEKGRRRGLGKRESRKEKSRAKKKNRSKSRKTETVIVDETVEIDQDSVRKPRITGKPKNSEGGRKKPRTEGNAKRKKKKDSPVEGFMSALRQRRNEMDGEDDDDYEDGERKAG